MKRIVRIRKSRESVTCDFCGNKMAEYVLDLHRRHDWSETEWLCSSCLRHFAREVSEEALRLRVQDVTGQPSDEEIINCAQKMMLKHPLNPDLPK